MSPALLRISIALALAWTLACGRPPGVPDQSVTGQHLPFDREPRQNGISPSQSGVPSNTRVPEGTSLAVSLRKPLSSATARPGDSFEGALDDPVVVEQQTLLPRGTQVRGRVLDARRSSSSQNPGYLRITLVSVTFGSKTILIDTSSIFAKAGPHDRASAAATNSMGGNSGVPNPGPNASSNPNEVLFTPDRRLTFRLAQAVDLQ
jgi:hypothetical protein